MVFLWGALLATAVAFLWLRRKWRRARAWGQSYGEAMQAMQGRDLALARQKLEEADTICERGSGFMRTIRAAAAQKLRTELHYRAGELARCRTMASDQLQVARTVT